MPEDIGICELSPDGKVIRLGKEFYRQGEIFKSQDAYQNHPNAPCYVPELSDSVYTAEGFCRICKGQKAFADELFKALDWQHPEALLEEWIQNGEWAECQNCGGLVDYDGGCENENCPCCGAKIEEE